MRRRAIVKRVTAPDARFRSRQVQKFINMLMERGKKSTAERIVYQAMDAASTKAKVENPLDLFTKALENVRPLVEVKSRRVGGATYQVPIEVRQDRGIFLAMRWIRDFARGKAGGPMSQRLADELAAAYQSQGSAVKKKEDLHRMAEANKAFSHYRW
ncbi:MAG: 30S ribosomal protein S7 [Candidatus Omnitrophica bacterium CG11_big_fil_rev_8_21_14_0_20_64_10]|nr:MAG: 30S ribosomal protein S7 [Candidatus Omnitrophica bacterium CG11_big_fil_rev_8_21_14_0_20_64_10]